MSEHPIVAALREVTDPEVGVDIVSLGLVRKITHSPDGACVSIIMTLTTPSCPAGAVLAAGARRRVERVPGVRRVEVALALAPPWTPEDMGRPPDLSVLDGEGTVSSCAVSP